MEKGSRSEIAYITHQCARFFTCTKQYHAETIQWLSRYLKGTKDKGTILRPVKERVLEVYLDAAFAGNWDAKEYADLETERSRHGYYIIYGGCPILCKYRLQIEISLSSTESYYTGLGCALRESIPIMNIFKEMKSFGLPITSSKERLHCKVFEENIGALEISRIAKFFQEQNT